MMRKSTINRVTKFALILFGIWPNASCIMFCRIFWTVTIAMILICHYLYIVKNYSYDNIFNLLESVSTFLGFLKLMFKFGLFWFNQRIFDKVLTMMAEDWNECTNSDVEIHEILNKEKISNYITNMIITLHTVLVIFYGISIILDNVDIANYTSYDLPHIYKAVMPFSINTQGAYKVVLILEWLHLIMTSWGMGIINALLLILILHVGGQINILCSWLAELMSKADTGKSVIILMTEKIIRKHQKIIYFAKISKVCIRSSRSYNLQQTR
ncbi:uncharacterized protein LOC114936506 [Nylanderia fulva]|uniref:uncharacterized protein LOC114936506 n=1 Tax=Nylanderia fulva TaxID=613905 RepID=UPI0010FB3C33|nr:uncharacterized protein LOC114936506 [Nylanderia fulva]